MEGRVVRQGVRLGVITPVVTRLPGGHAAWEDGAGIDEIARVARAADELGFDHLTCSEHIAVPSADATVRGATYWDPLATLGCLAAHTQRIRLATYVLVLGYHHPLELAKRYGTLDRIAGGRVVLGLGVGTLAREFDLLGVPMEGRGDRADDALRALRASMGRSLVEYHGAHYDYEDLVVEPHAVSEHVPFWIGGRSRRSLRRAIELADGWAPFGLSRGDLAAWLADADRPDGFEVVGQPSATVDPGTEPERVDELLAGWAAAGATVVDLHLVHHSLEHYLEQLHALGVVSGVQAGFLSLTSGPVSGDDASYLRWHLLDHLPEQYAIPGIRLGTRWRADDRCVALRAAADADLAPVRHAVLYLMTEPLEATLTEFARLGRRLAEEGRYPEPATPHLLGAFELLDARAAPAAVVSAAALPFRPHRGVYLLVERPTGAGDVGRWWGAQASEPLAVLLATEGVAGVCTFHSTPRLGEGADQGPRFGTAPWDPGGSLVTVVYLDGDVDATAERLRPLVQARWDDDVVAPRLAGPFRSPVAFEAWPAEP